MYLDTEIEKLNDAYAKLSKERKALEEKLQVRSHCCLFNSKITLHFI